MDPKRQLLKWTAIKWTGWDIPDLKRRFRQRRRPFIMQQEGTSVCLDKMVVRSEHYDVERRWELTYNQTLSGGANSLKTMPKH